MTSIQEARTNLKNLVASIYTSGDRFKHYCNENLSVSVLDPNTIEVKALETVEIPPHTHSTTETLTVIEGTCEDLYSKDKIIGVYEVPPNTKHNVLLKKGARVRVTIPS